MQKHVAWFLVITAAVCTAGSTSFATAAEKDPGNRPGADGGQQVTLKDTQNQVAANRKSKGKMRSTTNDDRWAAAKRNADRNAKAVAKKEGVRK